MNSSVVCPSCSSAPCSCPCSCSAEIRPADAVVVECLVPQTLKTCCICYDEKPADAYLKYAFSCVCNDKQNFMCDDCVSGWLSVKKTCPTCRAENFARFIRKVVSAYDADFNFAVELLPYVYDPSGNLTERLQKHTYLKNMLTLLGEKNAEFYEKVFSKIQDEQLTPRLQAFFNIYNFLDDNVLGMNNTEEQNKFKRFIITTDEVNFYNPAPITLYDFMSDDTLNPHDANFNILVNTYGNRWTQYTFRIETEDAVRERIDDEVSDTGLVYHNTHTLVSFLRTDELRNAFNVESPFWETARDNEMGDEIRAILDIHAYATHLWNSNEYMDFVFMNAHESVILENMRWEDYNDNFGDYETTDLIFCCEYQDANTLDI